MQIETKNTSNLAEYVNDSPYKSVSIRDFNPFYIEKVDTNIIELVYFPEGMLTHKEKFKNVDVAVEFIKKKIPLP